MPATDLFATPLKPLAELIGKRLRKQGVKLTLGGEPTYVPDQPDGAEWNVAAVGPTKLDYAYKLAARLVEKFMPGAVTVFSPGKRYPGEINPRWVVNLLANRDGTPIAPPPATGDQPAPPLPPSWLRCAPESAKVSVSRLKTGSRPATRRTAPAACSSCP